eukprot:TRINITY_DN48874_c0_g1_i1.p1 TRINITY_DN48874_c0_g1~~TRINITY_DN48874_c0_g1_i1.p1  ORF type:complete len:391 (-),score=78.65 TRINITY_DN48874_c0_g1_i1:68-1240(-)
MAQPQVLIIGAGVTGAALAAMASEMGLSVRVVEKSRGAGGRMATHSFRTGDRSTPVLALADLGAQYVTTRSTPSHPVLGPLYQQLQDQGVLAPFAGEVAGPNPYGGGTGVRHFTAPKGLRAISDYLLKKASVPVDWGVAAEDISIDESGQVHVGVKGQDPWTPRVVVMTQPVPQVLGENKFSVRGNFLNYTEPTVLEQVRKVQYSSRFAVAFFFDTSQVQWPYSWACRYFEGGDVRYVAHDSAKRGASGESSMSVVVHSGVPLGIEFLEEEEPFAEAAARMRKDLEAKLPELPWASAQGSKVHKWRYSQVYKGFGGAKPAPDWVWPEQESAPAASSPGCVTMFRSEKSVGLLCGDAVAPASNFEGCVYSAWRAATALKAVLSEEHQRSDL